MGADYGGSGQNWAAIGDDEGRVYVANNSGVLTFDGEHWLPPVPMNNGGLVRALARTASGRLLVGGSGEIGELTPRTGLPPLYRSLTTQLPDSNQLFGTVWRAVSRGDDVAFGLSDRFILFDGTSDSLLFWTKPHTSTRAVSMRDTLFLVSPQEQDPIWEFRDGRVREVTSGLGHLLRRSGGRYTARIGNTDYVLGADSLYAVTPSSITALRAFQADEITDSWPYALSASPGGALVISTVESGAFVLDASTGRTLRRITRASGLPEDVTQCAYVDPAGGLWLCHDLGVSRVQLLAPLRTYAHPDVPISVNDALLLGDTVHTLNVAGYASFSITPDGITLRDQFKLLDGRHLLATPYGLLAGHYRGIQTLSGERRDSIALRAGVKPYALTLSLVQGDGSRAVAGLEKGPCLLRWSGGRWRKGNCLLDTGVTGIVNSALAPDGDVWFGTDYQGLLRVRYDSVSDSIRLVRHYTDEVLSTMASVPLRFGDALYVTGDTLLRLDGETFRPDDTAFGRQMARFDPSASVLRETGRGRLAVLTSDTLGLIAQSPRFDVERFTHPRLKSSEVLEVLDYPDGSFLVMGLLSISRVDPSLIDALPFSEAPRLSTIRHIGPDSLVPFASPLSPFQRDLAFSFATLSTDQSAPTQYRTRLIGYETEWSNWTVESERVFTNLPPGQYAFEMQAMDAWGRMTDIRSAPLKLSPRWFQTWWALLLLFVLTLLLLALVVTQIVRWRGRKMSERNAELETLVAQRTSDLEAQSHEQVRLNQRLHESNAKLEQADKQKTALLGMAAHDLRNPIANVKSLSELLKLDLPGDMGEEHELVDLIHESAESMLTLISDLLSSNEAEQGTIKLNLHPFDAEPVGRAAVDASQARAQAKEQTIEWNGQPLTVYADSERVRDVLLNLLSNAIKFSARGSTIRVRLLKVTDRARFEVEDEGPGLSPEDKSRLFQPFQKLSARPTEGESSSGLGLHIVRQYVERMGGEVHADSVPGQGSTFWFTLPLKTFAEGVGERHEAGNAGTVGR